MPKSRARGRPREFDPDRALDAAIEIFSERGYHGTSITDLADATDLTTGSLYKAFTDKRGILLAAFDRYRSVRSAKLETALAQGANGREKIKAALAFHAGAAHGVSGRRGCLVVSMANELAAHDPVIAERVAKAHAANEAIMRELVIAGQADGSVSTSLDPVAAGLLLLFLLQGLRVVGKTSRPEAQMLAAAELASRILD
ncbi:TetR family transcriptional regulator [Pararhizobium antarcticum]|uniref:TetR family transcriptional regulator n=2 Tax=Pararhizobium antarcticum TaxID=1798805 RepID=A0A657LRT6_9HYPH|nr:TetR family transcriptional regulator [Rhizobium sp. 58]OJF95130.1 TetR family transcriptional regulator [Pararhizobium antarcticum]